MMLRDRACQPILSGYNDWERGRQQQNTGKKCPVSHRGEGKDNIECSRSRTENRYETTVAQVQRITVTDKTEDERQV
jgi:hypothetical protein